MSPNASNPPGGATPPRPLPPKRTRERRSQEQRSAETKAKVITAATEAIAELGVHGATMTNIGQRAGVTWGAMQHQFGDKDGILDAVLEKSLTDTETGLAGLATQVPEPRARVHAFVEGLAGLLTGPTYPAFVEIQLSRARTRSDDGANERWGEYAAAILDGAFATAFGDLPVSKDALRSAGRFFFAVVSGIAAETMLFPQHSTPRSHFETLEETLLRLLGLAD